jgi:folate-binding Fe-S cluster repair protein YgfZ
MCWGKEVNDNQNTFTVTLNGEDFECNNSNTYLFTFAGKLAVKNHIFIMTGETDKNIIGVYIWETIQQGVFDQLRAEIEQRAYPQMLNLTRISEVDEKAFERAIDKDIATIGDFIPDDF